MADAPTPTLQSPPLAQPDFDAADDVDEETRKTIELAMRLEEEEHARVAEHQAAMAHFAEHDEEDDAETLALAIRLQQEDDEQALRDALGVLGGGDDDQPGSPSTYSYEQLMRLTETVGTVSRGATSEAIGALRTMRFDAAQADPGVHVGEQCAICRMEFEADDELRVLSCRHAEHAECMDTWLKINKCCPICQAEVPRAPRAPGPAARPAPPPARPRAARRARSHRGDPGRAGAVRGVRSRGGRRARAGADGRRLPLARHLVGLIAPSPEQRADGAGVWGWGARGGAGRCLEMCSSVTMSRARGRPT